MLGVSIGDEIHSSRLVIVDDTPVQFHSLSSPSFYSCQTFNFPFRFHVFLSLLFVLKRVQVFSSAASRSRRDLDPPQAPSLSSLFHPPSANSIRRLQIRIFDFQFLDLSHHGGRECSDHHERSPNCEFWLSVNFLFPRTLCFSVYRDQFTVIAVESRTRTLAFAV